ncbi:MAG: RNA polymerase sigma factor [Planctomycetota bacterium]|nr:RNA polymerase sigma factor [Planctomycetota bacterium]
MTTTTFVDTAAASDEQLLLDYRDTGDAGAFEQLVHRYEGELYAYLHNFLRDPELAEDAFQSTFLQLHLKCEQFQAGRPLRPWLYRMAKNQAIDLVRRARRHRLPSIDDPGSLDEFARPLAGEIAGNRTPDPCARLADLEDHAWLRDAAAQLPRPLREIVKLVYFEGLKYREAAEALSIPVGTLKSRMHRALGMLKQQVPGHVAAAA